MSVKVRIYTASIVAFQSSMGTRPDGTFGETSTVMHIPAAVPAESIEEAAERCRSVAFERWPPSEGWYGHQAAVMPDTQKFIDAAILCAHVGRIGTDDEDPQCFPFEFSPGESVRSTEDWPDWPDLIGNDSDN